MEKDWEARFADRHTGRPTISKLIRTIPAKIAAAYWIIVLLAFFVMQSIGADMIGEGAIPIAVLTVPWSMVVVDMASSPRASDALLRPFISTIGTFVIFAFFCGGLNAIIIFMVGSAIQRRRHRNE